MTDAVVGGSPGRPFTFDELTRAALGVNPFVPEQNIEGGVRYFSQLLKMFGGIELALVAYNAGGERRALRFLCHANRFVAICSSFSTDISIGFITR
jgi:soluble lytic murein transglycosylase-like protein